MALTAGLVGRERAVDHVGRQPPLHLGGADAVGVISEQASVNHTVSKASRAGVGLAPGILCRCSTVPAPSSSRGGLPRRPLRRARLRGDPGRPLSPRGHRRLGPRRRGLGRRPRRPADPAAGGRARLRHHRHDRHHRGPRGRARLQQAATGRHLRRAGDAQHRAGHDRPEDLAGPRPARLAGPDPTVVEHVLPLGPRLPRWPRWPASWCC